MHGYVDPRTSDRAMGVELRILELGDRIHRLKRRPEADRLLQRLEDERRGLYDELAALAERATPAPVDAQRPVVWARRIG